MSCCCSHSNSSLNGICKAQATYSWGPHMAYLPAVHNQNVPWKHPIPVNTSLYSLYNFCEIFALVVFLSASCWGLEWNSFIFYYCYQWMLDYLNYLNLECWLCLRCTFQACLLPVFCLCTTACLWSSIFAYFVFVSIVLQLNVKTSMGSMSSMPSKAWQFPGNTKKSYVFYFTQFLLHICLICNCCLFVCLRTMLLFFATLHLM